MKRISTLLLFLVACLNARALNIVITSSGTASMASNWSGIATSMGHSVSVVSVSTLDDTTFFTGTDVLIVSSGRDAYSNTQIATMEAYVKSGRSLYVQAESLSSYKSNTACSTIIANMGSTFSWASSSLTGNLTPYVFGSMSIKNDTVLSLPYFNDGISATASCRVLPFLTDASGNALGWMFRPTTTSYGRMIFTTDQYWADTGISYSASVKLMKNIINHLGSKTFGDTSASVQAAITAKPGNIICAGKADTFKATSVNAGASPSYQWKVNGTNVGTSSDTYSSTSLVNGDVVTCTITATTGCAGVGTSNAIKMTVLANPVAPSAADTVTYCKDITPVALTATTTGASDTLYWYTVATGGTGTKTAPTPSTAAAGITLYYVSQRNLSGCEGPRKTIAVKINALPVAPTVSTGPTYCLNVTATPLTATTTSASDTLKWYTVATGGTGSNTAITPSTATAATTNYYVSQKNALGCEGPRATIAVKVNPLAATPTVTTPVTYCQGVTASALTATRGATTDTLLWYTVSTGGSGSKTAPVPSTTTPGSTIWYVSGKTNLGCEGSRTGITVNINAAAGAPTATATVVYCQNATAVPLTATAAAASDTLYWYTVATGGTGTKTAPTPSTALPGTTNYYVAGKNSISCEGPRTKITVTVNAQPIAPTVTTPVVYCQNATASPLSASAITSSDTLKWYTVATGGTGSNTPITPSTATAGSFNFYVSQKNILGCEGLRSTIAVTINPAAATPTVVSPIAYCLNATATALTATAGSSSDTLLWYNVPTGGTGSKTAPVPATTATGSTIYYVNGKTSLGCEGTRASITVNVNALAGTPTVTTPVVYCQNATATALTATTAAASDTLIWYTVASGGTGTKTAPTPTTTAAGSTNYYVAGKNTLGCEGTRANIVVTVNPAGATPTVVTPVNYCTGTTPVALTATAGSASDTLLWYTVATGGTGSKTAPTPAASPVGSTPYYVSAKTSLGCEGNRATITVNINALATVPTVTSPVKFCQNVTATALTATKAVATDTLKWYTVATGGTGSNTAPVPSTTTPGSTNYYVSAKSNVGCESSSRATITVNIDSAAGATTVTTPVVYCQNATAVALTATKALATDTLIWYTVATGGTGTKTAPTPSTTAAGSTNFYVAGKNTKGCEGTRSNIVVTVNPAGAKPTITTPVNYCIGATATALTATAGSSSDTLFWYTNATGGTGSKTAPTPNTSVVKDSIFYVSAKTSLGCEGDRSALTVSVKPLAGTPTVVTPIEYCQNLPTVALTATRATSTDTLLWYTVATGGTGSKTAPVPSSATPGTTTWYVSGKTNFGCEGSRTGLNVTINPTPALSISATAPTGIYACRDSFTVLTANAPTATAYQWTFKNVNVSGATFDTVHAGKTGYWVANIEDAKGCKAKDSLRVQVDTSTAPSLTPAIITVCIGDSATLTAHPGLSTWRFSWYKDGAAMGIPTTRHIIAAAGSATYYAAVTNAVGCTYKTNTATVNNYPALPKPLIVDTRPTLSISGPYTYYQWYRNGSELSSATSASITVPGDGDYHVKAIDEFGCFVLSDTVTIVGSLVHDQQYGHAIRVFPNPSPSRVTIESPVPVNILLTDLSGRTLQSGTNVKEVNLADYADGMYLLRISDEKGNILRTERLRKSGGQ